MMRGYPFGYGTRTMMGGSVWGEILMVLFGLAVLAGIVLLIIWAIRASGGGHPQAGAQQPGAPPMRTDGHDEAVAVAKRRLASGEITPEQYAEIMRTLGG